MAIGAGRVILNLTFMLDALLVTFREGLESFLIVGVIAAYLRKMGRPDLVRGVRIGFAASLVMCLVGAWLWLQVPNQPLIEGFAALGAALLVGGMLWQMMRLGRHLKKRIESRVQEVVEQQGALRSEPRSWRAVAGIAAITALLVTREGLEAVFYVGVKAMALRNSPDPGHGAMLVAGSVGGIILAGVLAWYWSRISHRLNMVVVLKVTAVFLSVFLVQLVIYGVHELAESGFIHGSQAFHDATEILGPDGSIGHWLAYSLVLAPLMYLLWTRRRKTKPTAGLPA